MSNAGSISATEFGVYLADGGVVVDNGATSVIAATGTADFGVGIKGAPAASTTPA